jgi:thioredoxin
MKRLLIVGTILLLTILSYGNLKTPEGPSSGSSSVTVVHLTNETFKQKVFDYEKNKDWKYEGNTPAIIDFYADWCAPCRQLSPILEDLAKEYSGKIIVYKVDTQKETKLSQSMGITALPTLLFIPVKGKPQVSMGALPKETLKKAIDEVLLGK